MRASTTTGWPTPTTTPTGSRSTSEEVFDQITIPVHTFGGWFDIFSQGTLRGYVGMSQKGGDGRGARASATWSSGPGGTARRRSSGPSTSGPRPTWTRMPLQLRWYDYFLKGIDNGLAAEPPVKLFVMGRNEWVLRARVPAGPHGVQAPLLRERRASANGSRGDGRLTWEKPAGASEGRPVPVRSRRSRPLARRQQLLRHADAGRADGPAARSRAAATCCSTRPTS